jgi:hypothetical protein
MDLSLESHEPFAGYSTGHQPLTGYLALSVVFNAGLATALATASRRGRLPERFRADDIAIMAVATHKIARLVTKDSATSFVRAPFVHLQEKSGSNSLQEEPRGSGARRSLGELLTCPECTGQWVVAGLTAGMLHAPRPTRAISAMFTALAAADLLQHLYAGLKSRP